MTNTLAHYWDAPDLPATVPGPTSVVVRSRCGRTLTAPAWQVREWSANGVTAASIPAHDTCPACASAVA
jgi:hypothetical protein